MLRCAPIAIVLILTAGQLSCSNPFEGLEREKITVYALGSVLNAANDRPMSGARVHLERHFDGDEYTSVSATGGTYEITYELRCPIGGLMLSVSYDGDYRESEEIACKSGAQRVNFTIDR